MVGGVSCKYVLGRCKTGQHVCLERQILLQSMCWVSVCEQRLCEQLQPPKAESSCAAFLLYGGSDCHRPRLWYSLHQGQDFFFSVRFQVSFLALTTAWRDSISICMWCHCRRASHSSALAAFSASASLSILLLVPSSNYRGGTKDNIKNTQVTVIDCHIKMSGWNFCESCINV